MPFRLIAIDLDGTLLNTRHQMSPANAAAVAACVAQGARVLIATGRTYASAGPYIRALQLAGPQIVLNGAVLVEPETGCMYTRQLLPHDLLAHVITVLESQGLGYTVFGSDAIYALPEMPYAPILAGYGEPPLIPLSRADLLCLPNPIKVLTFLPAGPRDAQLAALMGTQVEAMRTAPQFFEFLSPGINKGSALIELMKRYRVPREQVLVIGDGENDISMFGVAGMSVAMAGAPAAVQAHATALTAHCDEDGVALALRRYVLG